MKKKIVKDERVTALENKFYAEAFKLFLALAVLFLLISVVRGDKSTIYSITIMIIILDFYLCSRKFSSGNSGFEPYKSFGKRIARAHSRAFWERF